jgi:hypothetical protein
MAAARFGFRRSHPAGEDFLELIEHQHHPESLVPAAEPGSIAAMKNTPERFTGREVGFGERIWNFKLSNDGGLDLRDNVNIGRFVIESHQDRNVIGSRERREHACLEK